MDKRSAHRFPTAPWLDIDRVSLKGLLIVYHMFVADTCFADLISTVGYGTLEVQPTLVISELQAVDFGMIPITDGTCKMRNDGTLARQCAGLGPGTPGQLSITGRPQESVRINVSGGPSVDGVSFTPKRVGKRSQQLDRDGNLVVTIVGALTLQSVSQGGYKNLVYHVTINYQ